MPPENSTLRLVNGKRSALGAIESQKSPSNHQAGDLRIKVNLFGLNYGVGC